MVSTRRSLARPRRKANAKGSSALTRFRAKWRKLLKSKRNPSTAEAQAYRRDLAKALGYKTVTDSRLQSQLPGWVRDALKGEGGAVKSHSKAKAAKQYSGGILGEFEKLIDWRKSKRNGRKTKRSPAQSKRKPRSTKRRRNVLPAAVLAAGAASGVGSYLGTRTGRKNGRKNPSAAELERAAELYAKFHGKDPEEVLEGLQRTILREDFSGLGQLVSLQVGENGDGYAVRWQKSKEERPVLAADPDGKQLYILGGNHDMTDMLKQLGVAGAKDFIDLGEVTQIEYFTYKDFDNFQPIVYYHHFGEEDAKQNSRRAPRRPRLMYDALNKRLHLVGGAYTIKRDGIIN